MGQRTLLRMHEMRGHETMRRFCDDLKVIGVDWCRVAALFSETSRDIEDMGTHRVAASAKGNKAGLAG